MTLIMPPKDSQVPHCIGSYTRKIPTQSQSDRFTFMDLSNYVKQMWVKMMVKIPSYFVARTEKQDVTKLIIFKCNTNINSSLLNYYCKVTFNLQVYHVPRCMSLDLIYAGDWLHSSDCQTLNWDCLKLRDTNHEDGT